MADFTYQTGSEPRFEAGHNPTDDVSVRAIVGFACILTVFVVVVCVVLAVINQRVNRAAQQQRLPALFAINAGQYAGPALQDNPARDLPERGRADESRLNSYGWIEHGKRAHIPIERAIAIVAERGIGGSKPDDAGEPTPADAVRRARANPTPSDGR